MLVISLYRGWFFFQNTELNNKITIICISDFERVMDIVFCSPQMYPPNILQFILLYDDVRYLTTVWRFSNLPRHNFISAMVQVMFVLSSEAKHEIVWWSDKIIASVSWLLMSWRCLKMGHYQEWYRFNLECVGLVHMSESNTVSTVSAKVLPTNGSKPYACTMLITEWWCFILLVIV